MNARNGKIARLPRDIRDELNQRLDCSAESPELLHWLNARPEVKKVIKNHFGGAPINKQNISAWRQGGFQEWLARRDFCEDTRDLAHLVNEMGEECFEGVLADDAATVLAARFGVLMAKWDGAVDEKFEAKARVLNQLCRSVVQLQRAMHQSNRDNREAERIQEEKEQRDHEEEKRKLQAPFWNMLKVEPLAQVFGGGTAGRKIAKYIVAIRNDRLDAKFDLLDTDTFGDEQPARRKAKPVKPASKRRPVPRTRKIRPEEVYNTLMGNKMESGTEIKSDPDELRSVKVGQASLQEPTESELKGALGLGTEGDSTTGAFEPGERRNGARNHSSFEDSLAIRI